jgi:two-component system cell cycle sensor histidine kinase/response regulator CckA
MTEASVACTVVLLVEDDTAVRDVIGRFLGAHGYDVVLAASAEEGLALMESRAIDILVTDVVLPGLDGFNMAAEVARRSPSTRMHFMSGQFDVSMAMAAGWAADTPVLRKPFALFDLLRLLRESTQAAADTADPGERGALRPPPTRP